MARSAASIESVGSKLVVGFLIVALLPPAIMFLAAGRADGWEARVMIGVLALTTIVSRVILIVKHPDLAVERARWIGKQDFKSWDRKLWVFIPVLLTCIMLVVRTALEDKTLQQELPGYIEYTKTRYRLLPGGW